MAYIVLRLQGHVTVTEQSRTCQCRVGGPSQNSCCKVDVKSSVFSLLRKTDSGETKGNRNGLRRTFTRLKYALSYSLTHFRFGDILSFQSYLISILVLCPSKQYDLDCMHHTRREGVARLLGANCWTDGLYNDAHC